MKQSPLRKLLKLYKEATPQEITEGKSWYNLARVYFTQLGRKYDTKPSVVLGVVASLSPFVKWDTQLQKTEEFIANELQTQGSGVFPGFKSNLRTARNILTNVSFSKSLKKKSTLSLLRGPKVRAFYKNLIGLKSPITLDRHAISAALGRRIGQHEKITKSTLKSIYQAYYKGAKKLGMGNCEFQAIVWNLWRNRK